MESNNKLCIISVSLSFFRVCCVCALNVCLGEVGKGILLFVSFSKRTKNTRIFSFQNFSAQTQTNFDQLLQKWRKISSRDASRADSLARLIRRVDVIIIIIIIINEFLLVCSDYFSECLSHCAHSLS